MYKNVKIQIFHQLWYHFITLLCEYAMFYYFYITVTILFYPNTNLILCTAVKFCGRQKFSKIGGRKFCSRWKLCAPGRRKLSSRQEFSAFVDQSSVVPFFTVPFGRRKFSQIGRRKFSSRRKFWLPHWARYWPQIFFCSTPDASTLVKNC